MQKTKPRCTWLPKGRAHCMVFWPCHAPSRQQPRSLNHFWFEGCQHSSCALSCKSDSTLVRTWVPHVISTTASFTPPVCSPQWADDQGPWLLLLCWPCMATASSASWAREGRHHVQGCFASAPDAATSATYPKAAISAASLEHRRQGCCSTYRKAAS